MVTEDNVLVGVTNFGMVPCGGGFPGKTNL